MVRKIGIRDGALSFGVLGGVMFALVSVDARVREHVTDLVGTGHNMAPLQARLGDLAGVLWSAARHQTMDNAPLVVFATVGVVLTIFMLRS